MVKLTTEDVSSALGVDIVSVMSARRNGVKKGLLLLRSQGKIVKIQQIRGRIALRNCKYHRGFLL